jgi:hypothetical protein
MNAIITTATGYTEAELKIFLWSIAKNCQNTQVFLIVYQQDRHAISELCDKYPFITPVYINAYIRKQFARLANYRTRPFCTWVARQLSKRKYSATIMPLRSLGQFPVRIVHERFFIARQIVKSYRNVFDNFLITDCRDVLIQSDPFSLVNGRLISGLEPETIGNERYTCQWLEDAYGRDVLQRFLDKQVICAGVTLGPAQQIENYLTELCDEMWKRLPQMIFENIGYDQAAHIYLILEDRIEVELTSNQQGIIATVSLEDAGEFAVDVNLGRVKIYDRYPAIVHQYDRHPNLLDFFTKLATESTVEFSIT